MKLKRILSALLITNLFFASLSYAEAKVINQGNPDIKEMALTFDDGYSVEKIRQIKDKLDMYNVKGTFFFVGSFIASNKDIVRELEADGHMVVSHSFSHKNFTKVSPEVMIGEIENTKIAYTNATDKKILPYFRPPYGGYNDKVLQTIGKNHDLYVVMWNIDTKDWEGHPPEYISNVVLSNAENGGIVLMHTTKHVKTEEALDSIIVGLQEKGYSLVRVDEMFSKLPDAQRLKSIDQIFYEQNAGAVPPPAKQDSQAGTEAPTALPEVTTPEVPKEEIPDRDLLEQKTSFINKYLWRLILSR